MVFLFLIIATLAFVELFIRFRIIALAAKPAALAQRSAAVIQSDRISDHWKERVLPAYSQRMFLATLYLLAALLLVFSPFLIALAIAPMLEVALWSEVSSLRGICLSTAIALAYVFVRGRLVSR